MGKRGRPPHPDILTPREWEVLGLLREGLTNREIAERLGVTLHAARYHVSQIISKLGVETREEAAAWRPEETPVAVARRRWWVALLGWLRPLTLAKAAGIAVSVAAVVGLAVLAWGVLRTSGNDDGTSSDMGGAIPSATPESIPPLASTYDLTYVGGDGSVQVVPSDGGGRRELFRSPACDNAALSWSPGGDLLLCQQALGEASLLDAAGSLLATIEVADSFAFLGWSPNRNALAYATRDSIVLLDASGRVLVELEEAGQQFPLIPVTGRAGLWSPDGNQFVYATSGTHQTHVYSVDTADDRLFVGSGLHPMAWMSDGRILVAQNYQPPDERGFIIFDVAMLNLADGSITSLPELKATPGGSVRSNFQMWLSADTAKGAVLTGGRPDGLPALGVYDFTARELMPIAESIISFGSDHIPAGFVEWSTDGSQVYWIDSGASGAIYSARSDGTGLIRIADIPALGVIFSPDARSIAYNAFDNAGDSTLFVRDTVEGEPVAIDRAAAVGGVGKGFGFAWRHSAGVAAR